MQRSRSGTGSGHRPELIADLDAIEAASAAWRTSYADPLIARVTPGVPKVLDAGTAERGKTQFDELRVLFDAQNEHLIGGTPACRRRAPRGADLAGCGTGRDGRGDSSSPPSCRRWW